MIYDGLLQKLHSQNELAMVLAHEMGHVYQRHPISSVASGLGTIIASMVFGGEQMGGVVGQTSILTQLAFTRQDEVSSDQYAVQSLLKLYGHCQGATTLFETLHAQAANNSIDNVTPTLLRTHPTDAQRIKAIKALCIQEGKLTPLPDFVFQTKD